VAHAHDPANWIARFYLAISFCSEDNGKPAIALRHFQILDEVLSRAVDDAAFQDRAMMEASFINRSTPAGRPPSVRAGRWMTI
jgi:hypothetical protein